MQSNALWEHASIVRTELFLPKGVTTKFTLGFVSGMAFALVVGVAFTTFAGLDDDSGHPYFGFGAHGETLFLDKKGNAYGSTMPYPQREERSKLNGLSPC